MEGPFDDILGGLGGLLETGQEVKTVYRFCRLCQQPMKIQYTGIFDVPDHPACKNCDPACGIGEVRFKRT